MLESQDKNRKNIIFHQHLMLMNDAPVTREHCKEAYEQFCSRRSESHKRDTFPFDDTTYLIQMELKDGIMSIYCEYGRNLPYKSKVFNLDSESETDNPRSPNQVETRDQAFCMYHIKEKSLHTSPSKFTKIIALYLGALLNDTIIIKRLISDPEEFAKNVNYQLPIRNIGTFNRNYLLQHGAFESIDRLTKDYMGLDPKATVATLECAFDFKNKNALLAFILGTKKNNEEGRFDKLVIAAKDENKYDIIFNLDYITKHFNIPVNVDQYGIIDAIDVLEKLRMKILND